MRVYIPFKDGSAVSYDGKKFTLHKQPVDIDANLNALPEGTAVRLWRERRGEIVNALETAWWKELARRKAAAMKKDYSKTAPAEAE
ncbi:MAG: hypothetical protein LBS00_06045 [Synergistaceae bacterium]|jgi:hypothetical protein|nr:hypothetical protein [Synergistaceae bacterium]